MVRRDPGFGPTLTLGGVRFVATSLDAAVTRFLGAAREGGALALRFSNAYSVALASRDAEYRGLLNAPGATLPDGVPVKWVLKRVAERDGLDPDRVELVRGPSFFRAALERSEGTGLKHFFLGTSPDTLAALITAVHEFAPGTAVAGSYAPPFGPVDRDFISAMTAVVAATDADVLWVSLGTPKQDIAANLLSQQLRMPVAAVGAAFDFVSGRVKEAPRILQGRGLEWVYRLASDPRRLWRRYTFGNARFLAVAVRALLRPEKPVAVVEPPRAERPGDLLQAPLEPLVITAPIRLQDPPYDDGPTTR